MGDRRVSDRRTPEKGVLKIKTKSLIIFLVVFIVLIISIVYNVILGIIYFKSKDDDAALNTISDEEMIVEDNISNDYSCDFLIEGGKPQIEVGETVNYDIKVKNINAKTGIVMFDTLLDYDSELLECTIENDENSQWEKTSLLENYLTMSRKDLVANFENQDIARLIVKAKENIPEGQYIISFKDLKFTLEDDESFLVPDKSININVLKSE